MNKLRFTYLLRAAFMLIFLCTTAIGSAAAAQDEQVWTKEEIESAREGIDYSGEPEPEEPEITPTPEEETEPEQKQKSAFWQKVSDFFNSPGGKIIVLSLVIGLLVFTILKFINTRRISRDKKLSILDPSTLEEIEENVLESDIERFLRQAVEAGNFKLAVRLMYLRSLQQMHESGLITWKKEKTNRDYIRELRKHGHYRSFSDLTLAFEIVWYGDTEVSRSSYDLLATAFETFTSNLNGKGKQ